MKEARARPAADECLVHVPGTALACIAVLDGVPASEAVAYIRKHYDPRAVETPWQRRYVARDPV